MSRQVALVAELKDKYEEWLSQFEDPNEGIIHILASIVITKHEEHECYKKIWKHQLNKK